MDLPEILDSGSYIVLEQQCCVYICHSLGIQLVIEPLEVAAEAFDCNLAIHEGAYTSCS
jgi:hypothetical protein